VELDAAFGGVLREIGCDVAQPQRCHGHPF
jgi:hypothetical protein